MQQPDIATITGLRDRTLMLVLLETGIRVMELTNLNIQDIDYENQTLRLCRGKGRKPRLVPIQRICLSEWDRSRRITYCALWIILHNPPLQLASIKKLIITCCKASHIQGTRGSTHTFRHTTSQVTVAELRLFHIQQDNIQVYLTRQGQSLWQPSFLFQ